MTTSVLVERNKSLQSFNTLAVPSEANAFARLEYSGSAASLLAWAHAEGLPVIVLGDGSNVLLAEQLDALVLAQACKGIEVINETGATINLRVAAGENWHQFVAWCVSRGYFGLENLALIPGTLGAAPIQNIGAYGVEIAEYVVSVTAVSIIDGQPVQLSAAHCNFSYRNSIFKGELADQLLIEALELKLPKTFQRHTEYPALEEFLSRKHIEEPSAQDVFQAVVSIRESKLPSPADIPNAGSFFKNPTMTAEQASALKEKWQGLPLFPQLDGSVRIAAAWLIEQCGFKQRQNDAVRVHADHALVVTNPQRRGGSEVAALAAEIVDAVETSFNVVLEREPRSYGRI